MTDFSTYQPGLESPPSRAVAVTPDDVQAQPFLLRGLMVGQAGDVAVTTLEGDETVLPALQPGVQYAMLISHVRAAGTTAGGIIGLA